MKAGKVLLLATVLGAGASIEVAHAVRAHISIGPWGCRVLGGRFDGPSFTFEQEQTLPASGELSLRVENAFGGVHVAAGAPDAVRLRMRKVVFLADEARAREFAARIQVSSERTGATLRVRTNRQDLQHGRDDVGFETHFTLEVPPGTRVDVANEFGEVRVADVAFARIDNGHDSVRVERVAGELQVNARHGDVTIDGVGGTLSVKLRHGNLEVRDVTGHAALDLEHGDLKLARSGEAEVRLAHGSFDAEQVRGGLRFRGQHAGVVARGVEGAVDVETAYRDVELRDLGGDVRVVTQHGGIEIAGVRGGVQAQAQYDDVRLSGVSGPIEVAVEHGGVQLADIEQGARVKASGDDVVIEDFIGALQIDAQRGDVHLTPGGALRDALTVRTQHGGILLAVPSGSAFNLDAAAPTGEVDVRDLPGLELSLSTPEQVRGKVGGGGPAVTLEARRGDVRLESRQALADRD